MLRVAEEAHKSDTGRQRHANEDAYFARAPIFAVADGMGGAQAGEVASKIAAESFDVSMDTGSSPERQLRAIVEGANRQIHELAQQDASRAGMGTTLTAALVTEDEVSLAHVGDSRAYLFRDSTLKRLTTDHSLVEELRRQGRLTDEQAEEHPQRSIITRALGPEPDVEVDTMTYGSRTGDVIVLCSDGLTTMIEEARMEEILRSTPDLAAAVEKLVEAANEAGGRDNITVLAFRLEEVGAPATRESAAAAGPGPAATETEQATLVGREAEQAGLTAEAIRAAAAAEAPGRRWPRRLIKTLIAVIVVGALIGGAVYGIRQIYFLGTDDGGRVALYRGLPYDLPFGIHLYDERYAAIVQTASLPPTRRKTVTDHTLRSHSDAVNLLQSIESQQGVTP